MMQMVNVQLLSLSSNEFSILNVDVILQEKNISIAVYSSVYFTAI